MSILSSDKLTWCSVPPNAKSHITLSSTHGNHKLNSPKPLFGDQYAQLPPQLYVKQDATPVAAPSWIKLNAGLAEALQFDTDYLLGDEGLAIFAGNQTAKGTSPLAMAYSGHQFGHWNPQLGDGRALLLGDAVDKSGQRFDVQLKGSGPTPFSRNGDGRAALGPVLREYVISEAMHALGVPTTRALAAVRTGEPVRRETAITRRGDHPRCQKLCARRHISIFCRT